MARKDGARRAGLPWVTVVALLATGIVVLGAGASVAIAGRQQSQRSEISLQRAKDYQASQKRAVQAARELQQELEEAAREEKSKNDRDARSLGFAPSPDDPQVYITSSDQTCSTSLPCTTFLIFTSNACLQGVTVKTDLVDDAFHVYSSGMARTGPLAPSDPVRLEVQYAGDTTGANKFKLESARCG